MTGPSPTTRRRRRLPRLLIAGVLAAVLIGVATAVVISGGGDPGPSSAPTAGSSALTPEQAGRAFLNGYVDPDGRVVRRDQGGDTVSEGQAYAMLVAVAIKDRTSFDRVWAWTQQHLLRPDGTLSWHWQNGAVSDPSSASDADLDAARALVVGGRVFGDVDLTAAGVKLGTAILDTETVTVPQGRILVAGNWATTAPYVYNPSYASPAAFDVLQQASPDSRWAALLTGSRALTAALLSGDRLPPDWARVQADGTTTPTAGPDTRDALGVRYSYDAARLPIRYAESCHREDVSLAARPTTPLQHDPGDWASRSLDGSQIGTDSSVVAIAAQAAVEAAAGDQGAARASLSRADALQQQHPTYYGGAWDALGRILLSSDTLGGCTRLPH